jgi:hypothetical protein
MIMNEIIVKALMEKAFKKHPDANGNIEIMDNGFQTNAEGDFIYFSMWYHINNDLDPLSTKVVFIVVERNEDSFCWDNSFYRNKILTYVSNDYRNWPQPFLRVFNIYNGQEGFIAWNATNIVHIKDQTKSYDSPLCLVASGWRCIEDSLDKIPQKEYKSFVEIFPKKLDSSRRFQK